ncbi:MAG: hypothetical protein ACD_39C00636G0008 [uncultured bacterium]|nr:MAG: hypothetical protein ACD_39C00636G0008 [uncultured bacterium]
MQNSEGRKTSQSHWDDAWKIPIRMALPSRLYVDILNFTRLIARYVKPGSKYIEIGCAPGKLLSWVAAKRKAEVTGLDYSEDGLKSCKLLFEALKLPVKLYQEDLFSNTLPTESFDVVVSFGVIEHFDDPRPAIEKHLELLKPGGTALICIPNYSGIFYQLQKFADPENLELHNLTIMNAENLKKLVLRENVNVSTYSYGSVSLWLVSLEKIMPAFLATCIKWIINIIGLVQPFTISFLAPMLVLEIKKPKEI